MSNEIVQYIRKSYPQYNNWTDDQVTRKWGELYPQYRNEQYYPQFTADYNRSIAPTQQEVHSDFRKAERLASQGAQKSIHQEDRNVFSEAGAGFKAGMYSLGEGIYKAGEYAYRGLGADEWADEMALNAATARREANLLETRGAKEGAGYWARKIGQGVQSLSTLAGGHLSKAGVLFTAGATGGVQTLPEAERGYFEQYRKNPDLKHKSDAEILDMVRTKSTAVAVGSGIITGVVTYAGGRVFGRQGAEAWVQSGGREVVKGAVAKEIGKQAGAEGVEEVTDQALQVALGWATHNPDKSLSEAGSEIWEAGIIGAILGGKVAGLRAATDRIAQGKGGKAELDSVAEEYESIPKEYKALTDPGTEQQAAIEMARAEAPVKSETQQMVEEAAPKKPATLTQEEAFSAVTETEQENLFNAARKYAKSTKIDRNLQDDFVQDATMKAVTALGRAKAKAKAAGKPISFSASKVFKSQLADTYGKKTKAQEREVVPVDEQGELVDVTGGPGREVTVEGNEALGIIGDTAVKTFSKRGPEYAKDIVLLDVGKLDSKDFAEKHGIKPGTVRSALSRFREAKGIALKEAGYDKPILYYDPQGVAQKIGVPLEETGKIDRRRGAEHILRRLGMEASLARTDLEESGAGGRGATRGVVPDITQDDVNSVREFIDMVGAEKFDDVAISVSNRLPAAGRFDFVNKLITLSRDTVDNGAMPRITVHELWHSLERYLPEKDVKSLKRSLEKARRRAMAKNPKLRKIWEESGRDIDLVGEAAASQLGQEYYRLKDADEWFAENMTDAALNRIEDNADLAPSGTARRIFQEVGRWFRALLDSVRAKLGGDATNKILNDFIARRNEKKVRPASFGAVEVALSPKPTKPEGVGEDEKLRRTVERTIPEGHEAEKDPEAWRRSQSLAEGKELVETLTEEELAEYTENPDAFLENYGENFAGLAGIEAYNRARKRGEKGTREMVELSKLGSHVGQLLRQFAELKSSNPEYAARLIANNMEQDGIKLTEDQVATLIENLERIIEAQGAYDVAAVKARKTGTKENLEEAGEAHKALVKAQGDSFSYLSDISPRTFWRTMLQLMQGNLLTPISQTANIAGNTIFLPFRMIGDFANAAIDTVMTKVGLQDPQKQVFTMDWGAYDAAKQGTFEGLAEAMQDLRTGTKGDAVKGEVTRGFHPLRRIQQYLTGENLPRTLTEQEELASEAEKVLARIRKNPDLLVDIFPGAPAEAMFRMLTLGDKPFRKGKYRSVLAELASLEGLEGGRKAAFIKHPPAWAHETADEIAATYVFQEKSLPIKMIQKGGKAVSRTIEGEAGRGASDFAGFLARTQAPYIMTPTNLVRQFMEYVLPPVSAVMGIRNLTKAGKVFKEMQAESDPGKQRKLLHKYRVLKREGRTKLANAAIGQTMLLAAGQVIAAGLAAGIGRDRRERELMYKTLGPNTLNWSGLKRWLSGGDPRFREGDSGIKFEKLGPLGVVLFIQARKAENMEVAREQAEKRNKEVGTLMSNAYSLMATAGFALEQSFLRGANDLLRAATTPHGVDKWVSNQPTLLMSIAIPNTGMSILRARREFMPEKKGDTGEERVGIAVAEKMQSLTSLLTGKVEPWEMPFGTHAPVKQGAFGKPVLQTPIGANAVWYNMLDITKAAPASADAAEVELYHLFRRTGDRSILPREPQRYLTVNRQKINLDRDQYAVFRTTMGHYQKFFTDQLMGQPYWTNADDDRKIKLIKRAYDRGSKLGKNYYVRNYMK